MIKLSPVMQDAITLATKYGKGRLCRYPGGFWSVPGLDCQGGAPNRVTITSLPDYFSANTVRALVNRGVAEYTDWAVSRTGKFEVEITIK